MKAKYKKIIYGLIQLISIVLLAPLAESKAEEAENKPEQETVDKEPQLCLELGIYSPNMQLILCNTSAAVAAPDKYRLVLEVKSGEVRCVRCRTTAGKLVELIPEKPVPLSKLLDSKTLQTDKKDRTFIFTLVPGKSRYAELILSIKDAEGNVVGESVPVVYHVTNKDRLEQCMVVAYSIVAGCCVFAGAVFYLYSSYQCS